MFYELDHPMDARYYKIQRDTDLDFPVHIHHCFELICVTSGEMIVTLDEQEYCLSAGQALIVFPNRMHSIRTPQSSDDVIVIFSRELVGTYSKAVGGMVPRDSIFVPSPHLFELTSALSPDADLISVKGLLYSLFGEFHKTAEYVDSTLSSSSLLYRMFKFIEKNYGGDCSLSALAHELGYEYTYMSRYFKQCVGISYNDYVNEYRTGRVCYFLTSTDRTVLEISDECGFNSLRSLNRNFKERLGMTPTEYRRARADIKDSKGE